MDLIQVQALHVEKCGVVPGVEIYPGPSLSLKSKWLHGLQVSCLSIILYLWSMECVGMEWPMKCVIMCCNVLECVGIQWNELVMCWKSPQNLAE